MARDGHDSKNNSDEEEEENTLYVSASDQMPANEITIKLEADRKRKITIISEPGNEPVEKRAPSAPVTPRRRRTSDDLRRQTLLNNAIRSQSQSLSRSRSRSRSRGRPTSPKLGRTRSTSGDQMLRDRDSRSRSRSRSRSKSRGRSRTRAVAVPAPKEVKEVKEDEKKPEFRLPTHLCAKNVIGSLSKKKVPECLQLPAPLFILTEQQVVGASEKKTVQFVTKVLLTSQKLTMDERKKLYAEMVEAEYVGTSRSTTDLSEDEPEEEFQCKIYYSDKGVYIHTVQNVKKLRSDKTANVSEQKNYANICKTKVIGKKGAWVEGSLNVSCQESFSVEKQVYTRAEQFKIGLKNANVNGDVVISSFKSTFDPTKTTHFDELIKFDKENIGILLIHKASADMTKMWAHEMGSFGEEQCEYRELDFRFELNPPQRTRLALPSSAKTPTKTPTKTPAKTPSKTPSKTPNKTLVLSPAKTATQSATKTQSSASTSNTSNSSAASSSASFVSTDSSSNASMGTPSIASSSTAKMDATNTDCTTARSTDNTTNGILSDPSTSGSLTPNKMVLSDEARSERSSRRSRSRAKRHKQRKRASSAASKSSGSAAPSGPKKQKSLDRMSSRKDRKDDAPLVFNKAAEMNATLNNETFIQTLPQATSTPKSPGKTTNTTLLRSEAKSPSTPSKHRGAPTIRERSATRMSEVDAKGSENEVDLDKSLNAPKKAAAKNLSLVLETEQKAEEKAVLTTSSLHKDRLSSHSGKSIASPKGTLRVKETKVTREVREEKGKPAEISEKKEETVKEEKVKLRGRSQSPSVKQNYLELSAHEATHQTVQITPIKVDQSTQRKHQESVQIQMLVDKKYLNLNLNFHIIADKRPDVEVLGFSFAGKKLWEKSSDWPISSANTTSQTKTIAVQASSILEQQNDGEEKK